MERVACVECRQCNHKGKPSVRRFSPYCDKHYKHGVQVKNRFGFLTNIRDKLVERRQKYDDDGNLQDFNAKGFRKSWFWR